MQISASFDYSRVQFDKTNTVHLMVSATAPKVDWQQARQPLALVAALDGSSSMMGEKLDYARRSLLKMIDNLTSQDRLAIVAFDTCVRTVLPMCCMTAENKDRARKGVLNIQAQGCTNFSGAVTESIRQARAADAPCRIVLFTDGQPTAGDCNLENIASSVRDRGHNITISMFGYGRDHEAKFLSSLSQIGAGNFFYVQTPDECLTAFAKELGGLLSCYAQNLSFTIMPREGVVFEEVLNDLDVEQLDGGAVRVAIPDLYGEETKHIVLRLQTPVQHNVLPRDKTVAEIELRYDSVGAAREIRETVKAKIQYVRPEDVQKDADKTVADQIGLAKIAKAYRTAQDHAASGNFADAQLTFSALDLSLCSDDVRGLQSESMGYFLNATAYAGCANDVAATQCSLNTQRAATKSMARCYRSSSAQDAMVQNFSDATPIPPVGVPDVSLQTLASNVSLQGSRTPDVTWAVSTSGADCVVNGKKTNLTKRRSAW